MPTQVKIKIVDDSFIRNEIDQLYEKTDQVLLAKWSLKVTKHALDLAHIDYVSVELLKEAIGLNELWQVGKCSVHDVRQAGFKVHKLARESQDPIYKTALRLIGQAVASGHMSEHAMVASDYAIKLVGLMTENDLQAISRERTWQLKALKQINKA